MQSCDFAPYEALRKRTWPDHRSVTRTHSCSLDDLRRSANFVAVWSFHLANEKIKSHTRTLSLSLPPTHTTTTTAAASATPTNKTPTHTHGPCPHTITQMPKHIHPVPPTCRFRYHIIIAVFGKQWTKWKALLQFGEREEGGRLQSLICVCVCVCVCVGGEMGGGGGGGKGGKMGIRWLINLWPAGAAWSRDESC